MRTYRKQITDPETSPVVQSAGLPFLPGSASWPQHLDVQRDKSTGRAGDGLADLTTRPRRRRALHEQVRRIAELAGRTTEATQDRDRIARRLMEVRKALEAEPALTAGKATA